MTRPCAIDVATRYALLATTLERAPAWRYLDRESPSAGDLARAARQWAERDARTGYRVLPALRPGERPVCVPWVETDREVLPDGSAPIRLSFSVRVF